MANNILQKKVGGLTLNDNVLSGSLNDYKTYAETKNSLSNDGYLISSMYESKGPGTFCINPKDSISGFYIGDKDLKTIIDENAINSDELSNYLDIRSGGEVSGNVAIVSHDFKVLSGNYVQTADDVDMYSGKNAFIQADTYNNSFGKSSAGSKGFYVLSVIGTNKLKLSGDISIPSTAYSRLWSVSLDNTLNSQFSTISSVDGQIVTFESPFNSTIQAMSVSSESQLTALIAGNDNAFYCPGDAAIGNAILNFYGQHAEGGSVHAIAQYSHAEGRATTAEGRYSHAEGGNGTTAGGVASHAEGFGTKALGNRSHSECSETYATAYAAHAEGHAVSALGSGSHAEGYKSQANAEESHAEGSETSAYGIASHAEGYQTYSYGIASHAEGYQTSATQYRAHAEGQYTLASGPYSHSEGLSSSATNNAAHAEGQETFASGPCAHAEGCKSRATAGGAHAEGGGNGYAGGTASGYGSHAEGYNTQATGNWAHAEGHTTVASGVASHSSGIKANAIHDYSFVWNGNSSASISSVSIGTFNINPIYGIYGFYIGNDNFIQCVLNAVQTMTAAQKTALKAALEV